MRNGKINFFLHGSYLGSSDSYSDPLILLTPQLIGLDFEISGRNLSGNVTLRNFQDEILWARVAGEDWVRVRLTGSTLAGFRFPMPLKNSELEKSKADLQLSLVPDKIGILRPLDPSSVA